MDWTSPNYLIVLGLAILSGLIYLARWMGSKDEFVKTVGAAVEEIRTDIKKIFERLPPPTTAGTSPIKLTELGIGISYFKVLTLVSLANPLFPPMSC